MDRKVSQSFEIVRFVDKQIKLWLLPQHNSQLLGLESGEITLKTAERVGLLVREGSM